jgi:hypothetical protein
MTFECNGYRYHMLIEDEEDNMKYYHYAVGSDGHHNLLDYDPYGNMTKEKFEELVNSLIG